MLAHIGDRFGRVVVTGRRLDKIYQSGRHRRWFCVCDCDREKEVFEDVLVRNPDDYCFCGTSRASAKRWKETRLSNFWNKVRKTKGCWDWIGGVNTGGYGTVGYEGFIWYAHRLSWTLASGPIPKGKLVLHKCDNRKCVNPDHLFIGTQKDNMQDMARKGRTKGLRTGEKNGRAVLTLGKVFMIRQRYTEGGITQRELADEYGVNQTAISDIVIGRSWVN